MKKRELAAGIAAKAGVKKADAAKMIDAFAAVVEEALSEDDKVQIVGFGTFEVTKRPPREGRNPLTGEPVSIKASRLPRFKAGKALKDAVNK